MNNRYNIAFKGLKEGVHAFNFAINNSFFDDVEDSEITQGDLESEVILTKRQTILELEVRITGFVFVMCDRCLDDYKQEIEHYSKFFVKFGLETSDLNEEIMILQESEHEIDIKQYLFESIVLSLPSKKIHPTNNITGESACNKEMLQRLEELSVTSFLANEDEEYDGSDDDELDEEEESDSDFNDTINEETDPRWDKLKNIFGNKNNNNNN